MPSPLSGISPEHAAALLNPTLDLLHRYGTIDSALHESAVEHVWRNRGLRTAGHPARPYAAAARFTLVVGGLIEARGLSRWARR